VDLLGAAQTAIENLINRYIRPEQTRGRRRKPYGYRRGIVYLWGARNWQRGGLRGVPPRRTSRNFYSSTTSVMVKPRDAFCTKPCTVSGKVPVGVKGITFALEL
jgi:hypothetical protein